MDSHSIEQSPPRQPFISTKFIGHRVALERWESIEAILFEYILAGNGVMLRAQRDEFSISLPLSGREIKGLPEVFVGIKWHRPRVPTRIWDEILTHARFSHDSTEFKEEVYLVYWDKRRESWQWRPASRSRTWASTIADDSLPEYAEACIELHTHPPEALNFSRADDRDESGKFRIFGILIDAHEKPKFRFRCGVYDHLIQIPFAWIGRLPQGIADLNEIEALLEMMLA